VPPTSISLTWSYSGSNLNLTNYHPVFKSSLFDGGAILQLVLSRDDTVAPYGGFGYSFSGQPLVFTSPYQYFGSYNQQSVSVTCTSATARFFFFYARRAAFADPVFDSPTVCLRYGLYFSDSWQWDQNTAYTFTRAANHDGLSAGSAVIAANIGSAPFACARFNDLNFSALENSTYTDSVLGTFITAPDVYIGISQS
jgi:hypothetical protein